MRRPLVQPTTIALFKEAFNQKTQPNVRKTPKGRTVSEQDSYMGSKQAEAKERAGQDKSKSLGQMYNTLDINSVISRPTCSLTGYSIMEEVFEMEQDGTLAPFVEGEPIGKRRPRGFWIVTRYWDDAHDPDPVTMTFRRKAMLELRAKNDADLKALKEAL